MENDSVFGEVISSYTSQQAVEDGALVAVTEQDMVTRSVWNWLTAATPMTSQPPSCWPVDMMGWFLAGSISQKDAAKMITKHGLEAQAKYEQQVRDKKALALAIGLIGTHSRNARRIYENNEGGGIWTGWAVVTQGIIVAFNEASGSQKVWLIPNEQGGVTLMFPEDY